MGAVFELITVDMLLVIDFLLVLCNRCALPKLREIEGGVRDGPALGDHVAGLVFLEIGSEFGVRGLDFGL